MILGKEPLSKRLDTRLNAGRSFKRTIDNRTAMHAPPTIFPTQGDMHYQIERPERLARFRLPPHHNESPAWYQPFDQIVALGAELDAVETNELEPWIADLGILTFNQAESIVHAVALTVMRRSFQSL